MHILPYQASEPERELRLLGLLTSELAERGPELGACSVSRSFLAVLLMAVLSV